MTDQEKPKDLTEESAHQSAADSEPAEGETPVGSPTDEPQETTADDQGEAQEEAQANAGDSSSDPADDDAERTTGTGVDAEQSECVESEESAPSEAPKSGDNLAAPGEEGETVDLNDESPAKESSEAEAVSAEVVAVGVVAEQAKENIDVLLSELQARNRHILKLKQELRSSNGQEGLEDALADAEESYQELEKTHAELEESYEALAEERDQINDRMLRVAADLENYRRRSERDKEELKRFGISPVVSELIPAVDNMERALEHAEEQDAKNSIVDGVRMVYRQILTALKKHGVNPFESVGEQFNPEQHEAIQQVETPDMDTGTIVEEFQKGYFLHDRLLRPALVSVAKRVESKAEDEQSEGTDVSETAEAAEVPTGEEANLAESTDVDESNGAVAATSPGGDGQDASDAATAANEDERGDNTVEGESGEHDSSPPREEPPDETSTD